MAGAFRFEVRYLTVSVPPTLEGVSAELFARERAKAEAQWAEAAEAIQQALRESMGALVTRMVDRLTPDPDGKPKGFRAGLITAMEEFLQFFKARNLTDDAALAALVDKARLVMKGVDLRAIRQSSEVRETVRDGFTRIQRVMDQMVMTRPTRGIRFEEED
jgi:hypothetical protein